MRQWWDRRINRRAAQWSMFIGAWWGMFAYVAATDPNVRVSRAWGPVRSMFGTLTPWIMLWAFTFVCGVLARIRREFGWHVLTQMLGLFLSLVWVFQIGTLILDGEPVTLGAILLWGFPAATIILFGIRGANPTGHPR